MDKEYLKDTIVKGTCSVYAQRPFVCRLFGTAKTGAFSCSKVISGDLISEERAWELLKSYSMIVIHSGNEPSDEILKNIEKHDAIEHLKGNLQKRKL